MTSGQVASIVRRLTGGGVVVNGGGDAVGGEDDHLALGNLGLLLDEDRAALGKLLDHVLVVDDLLTDVDRGAVEVEGALDRLHGAVDAGAVAARSGEQDPPGASGGSEGHELQGSGGDDCGRLRRVGRRARGVASLAG